MELKKGYKHSEVGIIPEDWKILKLGEIGRTFGGLSGKSKDDFIDGVTPYIPFMNIMANPIIDSNYFDYVNLRAGESQNLALKGDLFFNGSSETPEDVGMCSVLLEDIPNLYLNSFCFGFRLQKELNIDRLYLSYYFRSKEGRNLFYSMAQGATRYNLSKANFNRISIPVPSLTEQTTIANILSEVDLYINSLEKLIEKKKNIKQGAMQQLLKPKKGWEIKTIKEVSTYRRGSFPQPYGLDKWYDDISGFPFIQVFDVDDNKRLKNETKRHISKAAQQMSVFVKKGSIILTIQGSIGRIAITQYDAYVDRTLLIFETFKVPFNTFFFMISIWRIFEIEKELAPGGIIKTITKEALSSFKISFPNIIEQERIANILSDIDNEIFTLEEKLYKAKSIKQGMMQNLLTGKTRLI